MLRCIVVDDERFSRQVLCTMLKGYCPQVTLIEECDNAEKAKQSIFLNKPDLIFLNIEMPDSSGFDLLTQMPEINFEIIFITAFNQYAVKAFKFSALDYLLKPLNVEELKQAVIKAEKRIYNTHQLQKIDTLLYNINYMNTDKRIALPTVKGMEFITLKDIIRCEAENDYTVFCLQNKTKIMAIKPMAEYEELLSDYHFLRVHPAHLVNLRYIKNYENGKSGTLTMTDGSVVHVSHQMKDEVLKKMAEH